MDGSDGIEFQSATPVLRSGDYARSRAFYADKLGFVVVEEGGTPARFGIFERGRAVLFVDAWHGPPAATTGGWQAYLHVGDVDTLCTACRAAGVEITRDVTDTVYGMREFEIADPDGNVICFGTDTD